MNNNPRAVTNYNNDLYGNYKMISIDGKFLAHVTEKRMNWYLDRDLAEKISELEFKLKFKTKGDDERGKYYKTKLKNICVVCGTDKKLTKHHVVPYQYRKYFPEKYKSKSSFDVLCVCENCHREYENEADKLKEKLLKNYGLENYNFLTSKVRRNRNTLYKHYDKIPNEKRISIINFLEDYFKMSIDEILNMGHVTFENVTSLLMKNIDDFEEFIIMWRKHFIEYAKPKFILQEWLDEMEMVYTVRVD